MLFLVYLCVLHMYKLTCAALVPVPVVIPAPVCEKAEIRQHVVVDGPDTVVVVAVPKQKLRRAHQVVRVAIYTIYTVWEITHIKV